MEKLVAMKTKPSFYFNFYYLLLLFLTPVVFGGPIAIAGLLEAFGLKSIFHVFIYAVCFYFACGIFIEVLDEIVLQNKNIDKIKYCDEHILVYKFFKYRKIFLKDISFMRYRLLENTVYLFPKKITSKNSMFIDHVFQFFSVCTISALLF